MSIYLPIQMTNYEDILLHLSGGRAHISIVSKKTHTHFTYRVVRAKEERHKYLIWVRVEHKYILAVIWDNKERKFIYNPKTCIPKEWRRYKAIVWMWRYIINKRMPDGMFVYRDERCRSCGKRLTNPESIKLGIGPECIKRRG